MKKSIFAVCLMSLCLVFVACSSKQDAAAETAEETVEDVVEETTEDGDNSEEPLVIFNKSYENDYGQVGYSMTEDLETEEKTLIVHIEAPDVESASNQTAAVLAAIIAFNEKEIPLSYSLITTVDNSEAKIVYSSSLGGEGKAIGTEEDGTFGFTFPSWFQEREADIDADLLYELMTEFVEKVVEELSSIG